MLQPWCEDLRWLMHNLYPFWSVQCSRFLVPNSKSFQVFQYSIYPSHFGSTSTFSVTVRPGRSVRQTNEILAEIFIIILLEILYVLSHLNRFIFAMLTIDDIFLDVVKFVIVSQSNEVSKTDLIFRIFGITTMDDYIEGIRCKSTKNHKENYVFMLTFRICGWVPVQS